MSRKIPVTLLDSDTDEGCTALKLDPDLHVGTKIFPERASVRPWWPIRPLFKKPKWYEATWEVLKVERYIKREDCLYVYAGGGWVMRDGVGNTRVLSRREIRKLGLPDEPVKTSSTIRMRFGLEKLYGLPPSKSVMIHLDDKWVQGVVNSYDPWRGAGRLARNRLSKIRKRYNQHMRRPTWLDRVLAD